MVTNVLYNYKNVISFFILQNILKMMSHQIGPTYGPKCHSYQ